MHWRQKHSRQTYYRLGQSVSTQACTVGQQIPHNHYPPTHLSHSWQLWDLLWRILSPHTPPKYRSTRKGYISPRAVRAKQQSTRFARRYWPADNWYPTLLASYVIWRTQVFTEYLAVPFLAPFSAIPELIHLVRCLLGIVVRYYHPQFFHLLHRLHSSKQTQDAQLSLIQLRRLFHTFSIFFINDAAKLQLFPDMGKNIF